ncbi:hypothetical protein ISCGN_032622 [Ixodes scapularis]
MPPIPAEQGPGHPHSSETHLLAWPYTADMATNVAAPQLLSREGSAPCAPTVSITEQPLLPGQQRCRFCLNVDDERAMVTPCACDGDLVLAHESCVNKEVRESRRLTCPSCQVHYVINRHQSRTFCAWLLNRSQRGHHVRFLFAVLYSLSVVMVLAFAWLQADRIMSQQHWLLGVPLGFVLLFMSACWMALPIYSLWLYWTHYQIWRDEGEPTIILQQLRP